MKFYKAKLTVDENGLQVWFNVFKPIHETESFYFCVDALRHNQAKNIISNNDKLHPVTVVKNSGFIRVYRIAKNGSSRIAYPSRELAIENLIYRTKLRIKHMMRELDFCKAFLENKEKLSINYESNDQLIMNIGNTKEIVHKYFRFFY